MGTYRSIGNRARGGGPGGGGGLLGGGGPGELHYSVIHPDQYSPGFFEDYVGPIETFDNHWDTRRRGSDLHVRAVGRTRFWSLLIINEAGGGTQDWLMEPYLVLNAWENKADWEMIPQTGGTNLAWPTVRFDDSELPHKSFFRTSRWPLNVVYKITRDGPGNRDLFLRFRIL